MTNTDWIQPWGALTNRELHHRSISRDHAWTVYLGQCARDGVEAKPRHHWVLLMRGKTERS